MKEGGFIMKKKKLVALSFASILAASLFTGCGEKANTDVDTNGDITSKELNLFTWDGMFPQEVLDAFTEETGIKINYSNFDYDEDMLAKLETSKGGDYDVVIADDYIIQLAIEEGLVQKLDKSQIKNWDNINEKYQGQFYDEKDEYTVPYGAGIQTIVYNPEVVKTGITGYAGLWDSSLKDNIAITSNYRVINGMALKIMGESYNVEDTAKIEEAGETLLELAPNIRLINDNNTQDYIINGEVGAAVMYTSQVTMARLANPDLKVVYPEEGIGFGIMANFIPSNAPHADAAYAFIDYILRPEVSAKCFEYIGYYCTNVAAESYISDEMKDLLILPGELDNIEMIQPIGKDAEEVHTKVWTEFKSATGN